MQKLKENYNINYNYNKTKNRCEDVKNDNKNKPCGYGIKKLGLLKMCL